MGLSGCCGFVKVLVVLLNLVFWLVGLAILVLSILMLTDPTYIISMAQDENNYYIALYIFLCIGALLVVVAFLGCCGAFKESQCMLVTFFSLLLIILVAEIAAGSWAYYNRDKLDQMIHVHVDHTVKEEYSVIPTRTVAFDAVQRHLECCGASGPSDWAGSKFNQKSNRVGLEKSFMSLESVKATVVGQVKYSLPESCCRMNISKKDCDDARNIFLTAVFNKDINSIGCMDKLVEYVNKHSMCFIIVGLVIIAIEFIGLLLALMLCCAIQRNDHYKA